MAPKRRSAASSSRNVAAKAAAKAQAQKNPPKTLMEATETGEDTSFVKRNRKRNLDEVVNKALADNFGTFSQLETDLTMVDGKSLRETIYEAKRRQKDGEQVSIGKTFYARLREEYGAASDVGRRMTVRDPNEPEDARMRDALLAMLKHNRDTTQIVQWLLHSDLANQKNFVALCRGFLMIPPAQSSANASLVLEFLRYAIRTNAATNLKDEMQLMRGHFDVALCKSLTHMKSQGQTCGVWWDSVSDIAGFVVDAVDVKAIFECKTSWVDVREQLLRVVAGSQIGQKMFAIAHRQLQENLSSTMVQEAVDTMKSKNLDKKAVDSALAKLQERSKTIGVDLAETFLRREVVFSYRGVQLKSFVHSLMDEWNLRKEALIREMAVKLPRGGLAPLWCESELAPPAPATTVKVSADLYSDSARMRKAAHDFLPNLVDQTATNIEHVLKKRSSVLTHLDRYSSIESLFFMAHIGSGAEVRLHQSILKCLPTTPDDRSVASCLQEMNNLGDGKLVAFCGAGLQATFTTCRNFLSYLHEGRSPPWQQAPQEPFWNKVQSAFANFLKFSPSASAGSASVELHGAAAAQALYALVEQELGAEKANNTTKVVYEQAAPLNLYKWLLSAEQCRLVETWVNDSIAQHCSAIVKAPEASETSSKKKGRKTGQDMHKIVGSLFK